MRRHLPIVLAAVILGLALGWTAAAQPEILGYVASDLQLISQESKADWSEEWTGPIQAATILAWFAENGYPAFIHDFNNDGVIDELDTIELADILGKIRMGTETARGTTDVRLVLGLARYVAERYPNQFVLKIYDIGFPGEFAAEEGAQFDSTIVPGIELMLEDDPSIASYEIELGSGEGVIVGLEEGDDGNTYLSGRSFLYETTADGYTPIGLACAEEDHWLAGHQGKVLETVGKMDGFFYLNFHSGWTQVECMLALSPAIDPDGMSNPEGCPDDAIAYDIMVTALGTYGSIEVEECVTRVGDIDTYTYTVTNIDFLYNGCGLCMYHVPKPLGLATLSHSEAVPWLYSLYPTAWVWRLPVGSCGILPGQSAIFSVSVPGPTSDVLVLGSAGCCQQSVPDEGCPMILSRFPIRTTGPGEPDEGCPDLIVEITSMVCRDIGMAAPQNEVTIEALVTNIGTETVTYPIYVKAKSVCGSDTDIIHTDLDPGDTDTATFVINCGTQGGCHDVTVTVDYPHVIDECGDEQNNTDEETVCCP